MLKENQFYNFAEIALQILLPKMIEIKHYQREGKEDVLVNIGHCCRISCLIAKEMITECNKIAIEEITLKKH